MPGPGRLRFSNGAKKTQVMTGGTTVFRRYAGDSVKFEDAQVGTMAQIQPGDQVRVRGTKSEDGTSIQAAEIVSGSFRNIAGTVASIDAAAGTATIQDLATKKTVVVKVTANSEVKKLPPEAAARFAARAKATGAGGDARPGGGCSGDGIGGCSGRFEWGGWAAFWRRGRTGRRFRRTLSRDGSLADAGAASRREADGLEAG